MVGGLVDARKLIPNWQWAEKGGTLLYMAEAQRLRNWHQIAVGMVGGGGGEDNGRAKNRKTV